MNPFWVGDVVRLRSGGPDMTVERVESINRVVCVWFDRNNSLRREHFFVSDLQKVSSVIRHDATNHAYVLLDETGSMKSSDGSKTNERRVVTSLNEYVATLPGNARINVFKFDSDHFTEFYTGLVENWRTMTLEDYRPGSMTPLYDSIGKMLKRADRETGSSDKVFIVIDTDGYENDSSEYTHSRILSMINEYKSRGWEFLFMASGITEAAARSVGTTGTSFNITTWSSDHVNRNSMYRAASAKTLSYFDGASGDTANTEDDWQGTVTSKT